MVLARNAWRRLLAIGYMRWERHESTNRDELRRSARELCDALRSTPGIEDVRSYWSGDDGLVVLTDSARVDVMLTGSSTEAGRLLFALGDLAHQTANEIWHAVDDDESLRRAECAHLTTLSVIAGGIERQICEECGHVGFTYESGVSGRDYIDRGKFARKADKV